MKSFLTAARAFLVMTILCGFFYPLAVTLMSQALFPRLSAGSLVYNAQGEVEGSALLAQGFKSDRYFWPRPSSNDFNGLNSGGSNLSMTAADQLQKVTERQQKGMRFDLLYASGSGLDPDVSEEGVIAQIERVSKARGLATEQVRSFVERFTQDRQFGILGEKRVNILLLNRALDGRM